MLGRIVSSFLRAVSAGEVALCAFYGLVYPENGGAVIL
jgi:hypothetical protein